MKSLVHAADDAAVADRNKDRIGRMKDLVAVALQNAELFRNLKGDGLFAFGHVGIVACVAVVPAEGIARLYAEVKGLIVRAVKRKDGAPVDQELGNLCLRRAAWHKDDVGLTRGRALAGQRGCGVARAGRGHDRRAGFLGPGHRNG